MAGEKHGGGYATAASGETAFMADLLHGFQRYLGF